MAQIRREVASVCERIGTPGGDPRRPPSDESAGHGRSTTPVLGLGPPLTCRRVVGGPGRTGTTPPSRRPGQPRRAVRPRVGLQQWGRSPPGRCRGGTLVPDGRRPGRLSDHAGRNVQKVSKQVMRKPTLACLGEGRRSAGKRATGAPAGFRQGNGVDTYGRWKVWQHGNPCRCRAGGGKGPTGAGLTATAKASGLRTVPYGHRTTS